jgi:hypothetical protein
VVTAGRVTERHRHRQLRHSASFFQRMSLNGRRVRPAFEQIISAESSCGDEPVSITGCLVTDVTSGHTYSGLQAAVTAATAEDDLNVQGTCAGRTEIAKNLQLATPLQFSPATLSGPGPDSVQGAGSVLTIDSTVWVENLTITGGNGGGAPNGDGGGITNDGTLTLTSVTVTGNFANEGGGIYNDGMLTLSSTTVTSNTASVGSGGGILNVDNFTTDSGVLQVTNSTIGGSGTGNTATSGPGGGIYNDNGTVTLTTSTITYNTAGAEDPVNGGYGGGVYDYNNAAGGVEDVNSTIISNTPDQCYGPVTNPEHPQAC